MKFFKKVYVEITNHCNLSCSFCPKSLRRKEFMDTALFEGIIAQLQGRTEQIYLHVLGEPLLHPLLGAFLELCLKYHLKANITTNGTLIKKAEDVLISSNALRQVNFSLQSLDMRCNPDTAPIGEIHEYLDDIFSFISRARNERINTLTSVLRLWNLDASGEDVNKSNSLILKRLEKEFSIKEGLEPKISPVNGLRLAQNVFLNQAEVFEWPGGSDMQNSDNISKQVGSGFCLGLRDQFAILVDGTVIPCCLDYDGSMALGNIKERDLSEILASKRASSIFNGFSCRSVVEETCMNCSYRKRFD